MTKLKGSTMSADNILVRVVCSDSEDSGIKNCRFPRKRIKPNILSNSNNELNFFQDSLVLPSTGEAARQNVSHLSSIDFLMLDKDLVALCEETIEELKNGVSSHNSMQSLILTCPEFIMRFNKLHDDLDFMLVQCQNQKVLSQNKYPPELQSLRSEYKLLLEQQSMLELRYPHMKEEIIKRVNILTSMLKAVNRLLNCKRHSHRDSKHTNLAMQMKAVRKWLRHVVNDLRRLIVGDDFSVEQIEEVFTQQKLLQQEIESRGREVTSLVRQCGPTDGATVAGNPRWKAQQRLRRAVANVERTWHNVWIRSLETQCHTEQLLRQREGAEYKAQVIRESTESDIDEEPLTKHRRLARDHWASSMMSRLPDRLGAKKPEDLLHASHCPAVSDKGIMVGTTGIAALKAEYGDDFSKLEIIQDVGYSSESSTHLSGDDAVYFYSYHPSNSEHRTVIATTAGATLSLKDELENALFVSNLLQDEIPEEEGYLNDSGFAGTTNPAEEGPDDVSLESDHLETVINAVCLDFNKDHHRADDEDLDLEPGGAAVEEPTVTFHNRTSFTTSAQKFYKMISVDSDNGEHDPGATDNCDKTTTDSGKSFDFTQFPASFRPEPETDTPIANKHDSPEDASWDGYNWTLASPPLCSTPVRPSSAQPNLKRKRPSPVSSSPQLSCAGRGTPEYRSGRVSAWLRHHKDDWDDPLDRRPTSSPFGLLSSPPLSSSRRSREDDSSSCDASFEYTSSSAQSSSDECCFSGDLSSDDCCGANRVVSRRPAASAAIPIAGGRGHNASRRSPSKIHHQRGVSGQLLLLPPPPPPTPPSHRSCDVDFVPAAKASFPESEGFCAMPATRECFSDLDNLKDGASRWSTKDTLSKTLSQDHIPNGPSGQRGTLSSLPCLLVRPRSYEELTTLLSKRASSTPSTSSNNSPLQQRSGNHRNFNGNSSSTYCCSEETGHKRRPQRSRKKSCSSSGKSKQGCSTSEFSVGGHQMLLSNASLATPESATPDRRRHFSELQVPSGINSGDGLHCLETEAAKVPLLEDNDQECRDTQLMMEGPAASPSVLSLADTVLTQLEEQSTVSDQLWDDYQALPYLSEAYSEATVDEDAVRKLTDFGDDYVSAIGPAGRLDLPDGSRDSVGGSEHAKSRSRKSQKSSKVSISQRSSRHFDSDSDLEDLHNVLKDTHEALDFAKATLNRKQTEGRLNSADYTDLLATCKTHLNYLQTILEHGVEKGLSSKDLNKLYDLVQEWELIKRCTVMYEKGQSHLQQKYLKIRDTIESLFLDLSKHSGTIIDTNKLGNLDELKTSLIQLQRTLSTLQETKDKLINVNVQVHHFVTEHGENPNDQDFCLKDKVTELYEEWDDTVQQKRSRLTELQGLSDRLECFELKVKKLRSELPQRDVSNCDNTRFTKQLTDLESDVEYLETHLKGGALWKTLEDGFFDLVDCLTSRDKGELFQSRRRTTDSLSNLLRSATHPNSSTTVEDDADNKLDDAVSPDEDVFSEPQPARDDDDDFIAKGSGSRFWRVLRAAVPIQLAIVLLYCLACYLEPHCCDVLNNFNFSLHPQLRYPRGPPPV